MDVTPLDLGIDTMGGVMAKLVEANTTIPTKKTEIFSTAADNQPAVDIHVLQGERPMAADNKTLGRFQLGDIPLAPRGVPQIEVKFDIDANGIVNVTAKDLGTGKEQHITITSSTNMSKEDIDKAVKEAEKFAAEDKAQKEAVDTKNQAESMIFQTEKSLEELGDKVSEEEKAPILEKRDALKKLLESNASVEELKNGMEELSKAFYAISEKLYQQAQAAQGAAGSNGGVNPDGTVNADFEDADNK